VVIRNINDTATTPVQMDGVSGAQMAIMVGRQDGAPNFALRQFVVAPGGTESRFFKLSCR
jgi:quercetin dioxygenase-like cupin family protein